MASTDRPDLPPIGTVASRVRAFQHAAELGHSTASSRLPRVMSLAQEAGTTVGRGRRMDSSFASPAGRASRDGNEGLRGDGRPPVGSPIRTIHSSAEKEVILRPAQLSVQRPTTSLDKMVGDVPSNDEVNNILDPLCKPRSLENLASPESVGNGFSQARTRLRPVERPVFSHSTSMQTTNIESDAAALKDKPSQDSLDGQDILNELDSLLTGALERTKIAATEKFANNAENTTSTPFADQATITQPSYGHPRNEWASLAANHSRLRSTSSQRRIIIDEFLIPDGKTDIDPADCVRTRTAHGHAAHPSKKESDRLAVPVSLRREPSPIRARAAFFEQMHYRDSNDYNYNMRNHEEMFTASRIRSIRAKLETENATPWPTHTPPIELVLPKLIKHPRRHSQRSTASDISQTCKYDTAKQSLAMSPSPIQPKHGKKVSITWPFRWNLFLQDKANPAPPKPSGVVANAETGHDEHMTDDSTEHFANHIHISPAKTALSLTAGPSQKRFVSGDVTRKRVTEGVSTVQKPGKIFMQERSSQIVAPQELQDRHSEDDPEGPRTPKRQTNLISTQLMTPTQSSTPQLKPVTAASSPRTPVRGRTKSERKDGYVAEQRYSLSRGRSRGGFKILVEVRSPDPSPEKASDDTVVIIKANVEPLEAWNQ